MEELDIHPARNHRDPARIRPEVPGEVRPLDEVRGHEAVRFLRDADLGGQPLRRLGVARPARDGVLDRAERVEHVDERHVPAAREIEPGETRQPVVTVHEVVADALRGAERLNPLGELLEMVGDGRPRDRAGRARGHVDHAGPRTEAHHLGDRGVLASREHVDLEPETSERPRQLADVHVHATRLLAAEGGQRTGVHRQHRDPRPAGRRDGQDRRHDRSSVRRSTSVGAAPKPYLYGSSPRRKS
jgi:hypothetical protein